MVIINKNNINIRDVAKRANVPPKTISNYLNKTAYLFLGHSESLRNVTDKFSFIKSTIYQKK